jgi:release factor glutamine methyltransferase
VNAQPAIDAGMTIDAVRRLLARTLEAAGMEHAALDARILVGHALGLGHAVLVASGGCLLTADERARLAAAAERRLRHEPVARIVETKEFWSLPFRVSAATLVPRPETELVVETALAAIDATGARTRALKVADLGTGTGALLLALLSELPNATGVGTDISGDALEVARENARHLRLDGRADFVTSDFGERLDGGFDLVVSNPPYVESGAIASLPPDVRDFDPRLALDGGPDGLAAYRAIAASAPRLLASGGRLVLEIGVGQATDVTGLLRTAGLNPDKVVADLNGIPRVVLAHQ